MPPRDEFQGTAEPSFHPDGWAPPLAYLPRARRKGSAGRRRRMTQIMPVAREGTEALAASCAGGHLERVTTLLAEGECPHCQHNNPSYLPTFQRSHEACVSMLWFSALLRRGSEQREPAQGASPIPVSSNRSEEHCPERPLTDGWRCPLHQSEKPVIILKSDSNPSVVGGPRQ